MILLPISRNWTWTQPNLSLKQHLLHLNRTKSSQTQWSHSWPHLSLATMAQLTLKKKMTNNPNLHKLMIPDLLIHQGWRSIFCWPKLWPRPWGSRWWPPKPSRKAQRWDLGLILWGRWRKELGWWVRILVVALKLTIQHLPKSWSPLSIQLQQELYNPNQDPSPSPWPPLIWPNNSNLPSSN